MSKKLILICLMPFFSITLSAQQRWGGNVDAESIHFGFSFHYVSSAFKVFKNPTWRESQANAPGFLNAISSAYRSGVGVGLLSDVKLGTNANIRFSPSVIFANKAMTYEYMSVPAGQSIILDKSILASLLEFPLTLKFKSDRKNNYRGYVLAGSKYSMNVVPKKKLDDAGIMQAELKNVKLKSGFFSYEFGVGVDIYFEYFKMSPQIKWSQSFTNVLEKQEATIFTTPIDKLLMHSIQFSLLFE